MASAGQQVTDADTVDKGKRNDQLKAFEYDMTSMRLVDGNGWSELGTFYLAVFMHTLGIVFDILAFAGSGLLLSGVWASNVGTRSVVEIELIVYSLFQFFVHFRSTFFTFDVNLIPFQPILTRAQAFKRDGFEWYEQDKALLCPSRKCIKSPKVIFFHLLMLVLIGISVTAIIFGLRTEPLQICTGTCCVKWQSNGTYMAIGESPCLTSAVCASSPCCASGSATRSYMQFCLNPTNTLF
jgi:hypothetical protein